MREKERKPEVLLLLVLFKSKFYFAVPLAWVAVHGTLILLKKKKLKK